MSDLSNNNENNDNNLSEPLIFNETNDDQSSSSSSSRSSSCFYNICFPDRLMRSVLVAVFPMFLFGYGTGVMNAPEGVIFPNHTLAQWSVVVSSFCIGGVLGANGAGTLADRFGRRWSLLFFGGYLPILAGLLHCLAPTIYVLMIGRVLIGVSGGGATVLTPMYLSELSSSCSSSSSSNNNSGCIGTMTQLSCVIGILVSILSALPFCTAEKWRWIFLPIPVVAASFIVLGQFCNLLPESPRWLILQGQDNDQNNNNNNTDDTEIRVRTILRYFHYNADDSEQQIELEIQNLRNSLLVTTNGDNNNEQQEQEDDNNNDTIDNDHDTAARASLLLSSSSSSPSPSSSSFWSFASDPINRIPLISAVLFPVAQQLSGINAVFYYSTLFFKDVIPNPNTGTILAFGVNVLATILAMVLMDKFGRKTLLAASSGGMFLCCIALTVLLLYMENNNNDNDNDNDNNNHLCSMLTVVVVLLYISFFEIGLGCIPFFLISELIPSVEYLGTVQSIAMTMNWASNFLIGMVFPYMNRSLGSYTFVPFATVLFLTVLYTVRFLPETSKQQQTTTTTTTISTAAATTTAPITTFI